MFDAALVGVALSTGMPRQNAPAFAAGNKLEFPIAIRCSVVARLSFSVFDLAVDRDRTNNTNAGLMLLNTAGCAK